MVAVLLVAILGVAPPLDAIAKAARGRVGFAARIVESGQTLALDDGGHYAMQSVYKLPISMALLSRGASLDDKVTVSARDLVPRVNSPLRDQHPNGVTLTVRELVRYAIVESDSSASDVLLARAGGPEAVTRTLRGLGIDELVVADSERTMQTAQAIQYRNWMMPRAALRVVEAARKVPLLLELMTQSKPGPARIKGQLPAGTVVAHKTGTSNNVTNDIGVITLPDGRHLLVAAFVESDAVGLEARETVIAKLARAAYDWALSVGK
jgi:beta-lactamase class A